MHRLAVAAAVTAAALAAPAAARVVTFSATFSNTNPPAAPGGRCPNLTVSIGNIAPFYASGTSTAGAFTSVQSHCLDAGPPVAPGAAAVPYYDGRFTYSFADGATLTGTYAGLLSNSGSPGVITNVQNFVATGGTGLFAGASGSFSGTGDIRFGGGPPAASLTIADARITVASVPEPASWGLLVGGFALTGAMMRRRTAHAVAA